MEPSYETQQERSARIKREQKERKKAAAIQAKAVKKMQEQKAYEDQMGLKV